MKRDIIKLRQNPSPQLSTEPGQLQHTFVRYADDCNVYVGSRRAGERVMGLLRGLFSRLRLRVNEEKSAVALATIRKLLGYSLWVGPGGAVKRRVADKAVAAMKERVRQITSRTGGRSLRQVIEELRGYLVGWREYFRLADTPKSFESWTSGFATG